MKRLLPIILAALLLTGCASRSAGEAPGEAPVPEAAPTSAATETTVPEEPVYIDTVIPDILEPETLPPPPEPARPDILEPVASGERVEENAKAIIDYSHAEEGYVMVRYTGERDCRLKARVENRTTYTYELYRDRWNVFPLTDGNGTYQIRIYENTSGSSYALAMGAQIDVVLEDEFAPFLRPNQYVDFSEATRAVEIAWELTRDIDDTLGKVEAVYSYVVRELTYDNEKARTVKSGYIPDLDAVLESKMGICFDYTALMTAMLRSQGIPCKMVFGYTGGAYHAWISVWTEDAGWVNGAIFFDGVAWQRLDPTFASYENESDAIMEYIGNGSNYQEKYFY